MEEEFVLDSLACRPHQWNAQYNVRMTSDEFERHGLMDSKRNAFMTRNDKERRVWVYMDVSGAAKELPPAGPAQLRVARERKFDKKHNKLIENYYFLGTVAASVPTPQPPAPRVPNPRDGIVISGRELNDALTLEQRLRALDVDAMEEDTHRRSEILEQIGYHYVQIQGLVSQL